MDIVSKNGNMLLNILQRPDGTIDDEALYILRELGAWFRVCGEGIYGTRPGRVFGEARRAVIKHLTEEQIAGRVRLPLYGKRETPCTLS